MTAGTYALILPLAYLGLQVLAALRLPQNWSLWSSIPSPVVSIAAMAAFMGYVGMSSEQVAILSLALPIALIILALLTVSWAAHGEG